MTLHFLNDVINDVESDTQVDNYVIITSLNSKPICNLINRVPGSRLLIST